MKRLLSVCLVIILLVTLRGGYARGDSNKTDTFTTDELQQIDLIIRNYSILSQENNLLRKKVEILQWENKRYKAIIDELSVRDSWWDRHKFTFGFGLGIIFSVTMYYIVSQTIQISFR